MESPLASRVRKSPVGIDAIIVISILVIVLLLLALTKIPVDVVLVGGLTLVLVAPHPASGGGWQIGIIPPEVALRGLGNPAVVTIGVLFAVIAGLRHTGAVDLIGQIVLGRPSHLRGALARIILPVSLTSAFLNNTPVVAMMIPAVRDWARKLGVQPSKLMMPLSFAAILGGACSLIGTSTNLVVSGLVIDLVSTNEDAGIERLQMFDVTWVGLPCLVAGMIFMLIFAPRILPDRGSAVSTLADPREYSMSMMIPGGSSLAGKSIEKAGLRHLPGCYLVEIERGGIVIPAVDPAEVLQEEDILVFTGVVESIRDLNRLRGLLPATDQVFKLDAPEHARRLFEAVVSTQHPGLGRTIRESRFRSTYDAVVIAVARAGKRLPGRVGDIQLETGDTLLLQAQPNFAELNRDSRDFLLVGSIEDSKPVRHGKAWIALVILTLMVGCVAIELLSMLQASLLAAGAMMMTRCCTVNEVRTAVDWSLLVVIAAALGLGAAMHATGVAEEIGSLAVQIAGGNRWWTLLAIYVATNVLTEIVTNTAAVALMFPVALEAAVATDSNFMPFVIAIMVAGSASFSTPLGYQTNTMVWGPGGYRFSDYLRMGLPMNALTCLITLTITPMVWTLAASP